TTASFNVSGHVNNKNAKKTTNLKVATKVGKKGSHDKSHPDSKIGQAGFGDRGTTVLVNLDDARPLSETIEVNEQVGIVHFSIHYFMGFDPFGDPVFADINFD